MIVHLETSAAFFYHKRTNKGGQAGGAMITFVAFQLPQGLHQQPNFSRGNLVDSSNQFGAEFHGIVPLGSFRDLSN